MDYLSTSDTSTSAICIELVFVYRIHLGLSENGVYPQWNSHLVGIMISKTIGFFGVHYFQPNPFTIIWNIYYHLLIFTEGLFRCQNRHPGKWKLLRQIQTRYVSGTEAERCFGVSFQRKPLCFYGLFNHGWTLPSTAWRTQKTNGNSMEFPNVWSSNLCLRRYRMSIASIKDLKFTVK